MTTTGTSPIFTRTNSGPTYTTRTDGPTYTTRTDGPTYTKIIGANHGSYPYRVGLNTLAHNGETFNADPECGPGGLYYCELKNICDWLDYGDRLCIVEPVGQIVPVEDKFKTDRLKIVSMMELAHVATWKFLFGMSLHVDDEKVWIWAARSGHLEVMKFLNESSTVSYPISAFLHAVQKGHLEIVKFLVTDHGVDINVWNGHDAFQLAAINGHLEVMKFLVEHSVDDLCKKDVLLRLAAQNGHLEVVKFLVERGADINAEGEHILGLAAQNGHLEVVKFLVDQGADVNAGDSFAMRRAVANRRAEIIKFLANIVDQAEPIDTWLSRAMGYLTSLW